MFRFHAQTVGCLASFLLVVTGCLVSSTSRVNAGLRFALAVSGISLAAGIVLQSLGLWSFGIIHRSSFIII